MQRLENQS